VLLISLPVAPLGTACDSQRGAAPSLQPATSSSAIPTAIISIAPAPTPSPVAAPPKPQPLEASAGIVDFAVPGYPAAVVSLPLGATSRRPIVVATHGNYDRPEWQCAVWRDIVGSRAFVLCPRGVARPDSPGPDDVRFTYEHNAILERELDAGLEALAKAYPDYVDPGPIVYTGFSLGAIQGVTIAGRKPKRSRRLVLIEGGHASWKPDVVNAFAAAGDGRVLFACSQPDCEKDAQWAAARLRKANVATRIVKTKNVGHRYDGPVADAVRDALAWVLEGDARFAEFATKTP
jgi:dienelactone hydrolase